MKRMRRILALMTALLLLTACGNNTQQSSNTGAQEGGASMPGVSSTQREPIHAAQSRDELFQLFSAASADDPIPDEPGENDAVDLPTNGESSAQAAMG